MILNTFKEKYHFIRYTLGVGPIRAICFIIRFRCPFEIRE